MPRGCKSYLAGLRLKAGLTQADVTKNLGLESPQYLSNVERGVCTLAPARMKKVAKMYGVSPLVLWDHFAERRRARFAKSVGASV